MEFGFFDKLAIKSINNFKSKSEVKLCINNISELFNHFSISNVGTKDIIDNNYIKINNDIIEYLKSEAENIPKRNGLKIIVEINDNANANVENKYFEKKLKEEVKTKYLSVSKKRQRQNITATILTLIGMALIAFTQFSQIAEKRYSFNEFIIVMSWVFMWKAVELLFFNRFIIIKEKTILLKIYLSEIIIK